MIVADLLKKSEEYLSEKKTADPKTDAELLLMKVLNCTKSDLFLKSSTLLEQQQVDQYRAMIVRRGGHEPVQYITGEAPFMDLLLTVTPDVLIPRFDTEILAETVIKHIPEDAVVVDIGTGSGALAIAIAKAKPQTSVWGVDISKEALAVAERNAATYQLPNIRFSISDCLQGLLHEALPAPLYLVSNPPYVTANEYLELPEEIRNHEPKRALTAPDQGLYFYKTIIAQAAVYGDILAGVFFEVGSTQADQVADILFRRWQHPVQRVRDVGGKDRVVYTLLH
jgi:release factor glutamine methyltransferase